MFTRRNILRQIEDSDNSFIRILEQMTVGGKATITRRKNGVYKLQFGKQSFSFRIPETKNVAEALPLRSNWQVASTSREHVVDILTKRLGREPYPDEIKEYYLELDDSYFAEVPGETAADRNFKSALRQSERKRGSRKKPLNISLEGLEWVDVSDPIQPVLDWEDATE